MTASSSPRLEFGGAFGTLMLTLSLPLVVFWFHLVVFQHNFGLFAAEWASWDAVTRFFWDSYLPSAYSVSVVAAWVAYHVGGYLFFPGPVVQGLPDPATGKVLSYRINGFFAASLALCGVVLAYHQGALSAVYFISQLPRIASTAGLFCIATGFVLYAKGLVSDEPRSVGIFIYDFWMGSERNPRFSWLPEFDLKFWFEGRPGLTGWAVVSVLAALAQHETHGYIGGTMIASVALQLLYIGDYFWNEELVLSTMDIVHDNFGFMLAFGDAAWVPFTYCMPSLALLQYGDNKLPLWALAVFLALGVCSFVCFRLSNKERNDFKAGLLSDRASFRMVRHDGSTSNYLVDGFSAYARRPNYWPDLLNAVSHSLPCFFTAGLAWFYPIYFFVLLAHRDHRLEEHGRATYANWDEYCRVVPRRFIPFLY